MLFEQNRWWWWFDYQMTSFKLTYQTTYNAVLSDTDALCVLASIAMHCIAYRAFNFREHYNNKYAAIERVGDRQGQRVVSTSHCGRSIQAVDRPLTDRPATAAGLRPSFDGDRARPARPHHTDRPSRLFSATLPRTQAYCTDCHNEMSKATHEAFAAAAALTKHTSIIIACILSPQISTLSRCFWNYPYYSYILTGRVDYWNKEDLIE